MNFSSLFVILMPSRWLKCPKWDNFRSFVIVRPVEKKVDSWGETAKLRGKVG
jgi:hypothetical protein